MEAERWKKVKKVVDELKPVITMMAVATAFAVATILYKIAIDNGMNFAVINAYRFIFATAFMIPVAFFNERKKMPNLTWKVFFMTFLCGLFGGTLFQNLYLGSLVLTSATFVSASFNLIPAFTFILAISAGLEKLNLRGAAGQAKMIGTLVGIGGAMVMTFVKGSEIWSPGDHVHVYHHHGNAHVPHQNADIGRRLLGVVCALGSCLAYVFWLIIQVGEEYPSHHTNTALMSAAAAIQTTVFAVCVERDWNQWKLGWNMSLLTVLYSGVVASGVMVLGIAWCVEKRGPLFVSMFSPLLLLLVAIASSFILPYKLYLGSVVGGVLIVIGLYMVLWGKGKQVKKGSTNQQVDYKTDPSSISNNHYEEHASHEATNNTNTKQQDTISPSNNV